MKKILALILAFAMLASILVACNEGTQSGNASSTTDGNSSTTDKPIWTYTSVDGTDPDPDPDPECNEHKDANNDLVCDNCNSKLENPDDPFNKPDDTDVPVTGSIDVTLTGYSFVVCTFVPVDRSVDHPEHCCGNTAQYCCGNISITQTKHELSSPVKKYCDWKNKKRTEFHELCPFLFKILSPPDYALT